MGKISTIKSGLLRSIPEMSKQFLQLTAKQPASLEKPLTSEKRNAFPEKEIVFLNLG